MIQIPLTKNQFCVVDSTDYPLLSLVKWYAERRKNGKFSSCNKAFGKMHRFIMGADDDMEVDHIDHDSLNNQRSNLRICTHKQNCQNKGKSRKGSSIYHGVYRHSINPSWISRIKPDRKPIHIGSFKDEKEAAKAYDIHAKKYFGEFANLNFPNEVTQ